MNSKYYKIFQLTGEFWAETTLSDDGLMGALEKHAMQNFFNEAVVHDSAHKNDLVPLSFLGGKAIMVWKKLKAAPDPKVELALFINKSLIPDADLIIDGSRIAKMLWPWDIIRVKIDPKFISPDADAFKKAGWVEIERKSNFVREFRCPNPD